MEPGQSFSHFVTHVGGAEEADGETEEGGDEFFHACGWVGGWVGWVGGWREMRRCVVEWVGRSVNWSLTDGGVGGCLELVLVVGGKEGGP